MQQKYHDNHRENGNQQFLQKVTDAHRDNFRLVGHAAHLDLFGQFAFKIVQHRLDFFTHLDDVVTRFHFDAEHKTLVIILFNVRLRLWIFTNHIGNILQAHHASIRAAIHYRFLNITQTLYTAFHINRMLVISVLDAARNIHQALPHQHHCSRLEAESVLRKLIVIQVNRDLFVPFAKAVDSPDTFKCAQTIHQAVQIFRHFGVSLVFAFKR